MRIGVQIEPVHVVRILDQSHGGRGLPNRAHHLVVALVPDEHDRVALPGVANGLAVDLGDQGTGGVDRVKVPLGGDPANLGRDAMGRVEQVAPRWNLGQIVNEDHASAAEILDDPLIVNDLVINVDGRTKTLEGPTPGSRSPY